LLINKENSFVEELSSEDEYNSEEDIRTNQEYPKLDNQDENDTAPGNNKASDVVSYEDNGMFSDDD